MLFVSLFEFCLLEVFLLYFKLANGLAQLRTMNRILPSSFKKIYPVAIEETNFVVLKVYYIVVFLITKKLPRQKKLV